VTAEITRAQWRKSSYSSGGEANCVEVALTSVIGVRDTKDRAAGYLAVAPNAWAAFITKVVKD
jgi:hypothetical protein